MHDIITIGDIKLDTFVVLDDNNGQIGLKMPEAKLCMDYGAKIGVKIVDSQMAGSAPNVAVGLARMKQKSAVLSFMGVDTTHTLAMEVLKKEGVGTEFIQTLPDQQSSYSVVLNFKSEKTILTGHIEHDYKLPKDFPNPTWLFVSEMGHGYEHLYSDVVAYSKKDGVKIAMNPGSIQVHELKQELYDLISVCHVLFVNREEAQIITKLDTLEIHKLSGALYKMGPKHVVITDGKNGAYEFGGHNLRFCPIFPGKPLEATGAGDSFATGYLGALMHGEECSEGLRWGAVNAASVVAFVGPQKGLLTAEEIKKRLADHPEYTIENL